MTDTAALERDPFKLLDRLVEAIGTEQARLVTHPDPKNAELALPAAGGLLEAIRQVRAAIAGLVEHIDLAWGVIANAGDGDWSKESPEWRGAAERWRDRYIAGLGIEAASTSEQRLVQITAVVELMSHLTRQMAQELEGPWPSPASDAPVQIELEGKPADVFLDERGQAKAIGFPPRKPQGWVDAEPEAEANG